MYPSVLLYKHKTLSDGSHPIIIQIIDNRKVFKKTLFSIEEKHWNGNRVKVSHPLHLEYNSLIAEKLNSVELKCIECQRLGVPITKEFIFGVSVTGSITIVEAIRDYQEKLRAEKKETTVEKYDTMISKIVRFTGDVPMGAITSQWIAKYYDHLLLSNNINTAGKNISLIQTVLKYFAGKGIYSDLPAITFKTKKKPTTKDKLSKDEFIRLRDLKLTGLIGVVRDSFLLAFYLRGMRISDVLTLQHQDIKNGRIVSAARKTDKAIDILIVGPAMEIIERYKNEHPVYVLPIMRMLPMDNDSVVYLKRYRKAIEAKTSLVNKYLKVLADMIEIDKRLTTHVARHTFAYLADQSGMTSKRIQDLLSHSDLKTTQNYIHDLNNSDMLDKAMDEFVNGFVG
jgi:integrase/recombinase XerD